MSILSKLLLMNMTTPFSALSLWMIDMAYLVLSSSLISFSSLRSSLSGQKYPISSGLARCSCHSFTFAWSDSFEYSFLSKIRVLA